MSIEKEIMNRIKSIDWCSNCGNIANVQLDYSVRYVNSWIEAKSYYNQSTWENKTLDAQNELATFLYSNYRNEYSSWNTIAKDAKSFIEQKVVPKINKIQEENNLDSVFADCVKWDILGAIMENEYKKCNKRPTFFLNLLSVYEQGNFPCGWDNSADRGTIFIF